MGIVSQRLLQIEQALNSYHHNGVPSRLGPGPNSWELLESRIIDSGFPSSFFTLFSPSTGRQPASERLIASSWRADRGSPASYYPGLSSLTSPTTRLGFSHRVTDQITDQASRTQPSGEKAKKQKAVSWETTPHASRIPDSCHHHPRSKINLLR